MAIVAHHELRSLQHKEVLLPWQKRGLQYTRSGYGRKIPSTYMVQLPGEPKWRRVYVAIFSNAGTAYVPAHGGQDWVVITGGA